MPSRWELPLLKAALRFAPTNSKSGIPCYDVKFYPWQSSNSLPVFAVVTTVAVYVCRVSDEEENPVKILRVFSEESSSRMFNSCAWSRDVSTGDPLLCIAGAKEKEAELSCNKSGIQVLNIRTGELIQSLIGHGNDINDLAVSPIDPTILASASQDHTIRLWSLSPAHRNSTNPCLLILAGFGHREGLLTLTFHPSGRYILSGGFDHAVCLWTLPEALWTPQNDRKLDFDKVPQVFHPHFYSIAIHGNYVDCVAFHTPENPEKSPHPAHSNLILSHAAQENTIVLWSISGFLPSDPPSPLIAPVGGPSRETRSAFIPENSSTPAYERLLTFEAPGSAPFYMRFSLLQNPTLHPVLAYGNTNSKVLFWDFARLLHQPTAGEFKALNAKGTVVVPSSTASTSTPSPHREASTFSSSSIHSGSHNPSESPLTSRVTQSTLPSLPQGKSKTSYQPHGPRHLPLDILSGPPEIRERALYKADKPILAHFAADLANLQCPCIRQCAWSVDGRYLVAVGDSGVCVVYGRG